MKQILVYQHRIACLNREILITPKFKLQLFNTHEILLHAPRLNLEPDLTDPRSHAQVMSKYGKKTFIFWHEIDVCV